MLKKLLLGLVALVVLAVAFLYFVGRGGLGSHEGPGEVTQSTRPAPVLAANADAQQRAAAEIGAHGSKQILFGDLHVHTTFSFDAFMLSLPVAQGEGTHPPADACDFARFCSALDFWSINDHAAGISPDNWRETVESIRQCNEVAGDPDNPDTVAYLGWEWTDVGDTPDEHFGHKNVVFAHTDEQRVPTRPIAAGSTVRRGAFLTELPVLGVGAVALAAGGGRYHDLARYFGERRGLDPCPEDVNVRDLPGDCIEYADTPADLFRKLDEWGHSSMVIPHGTTWGFYTPPGSAWDKQLVGEMHDPERQTLLEIYSGHGNSDVHRPWRAVSFDDEGRAHCPEPTPEYLPTCWRAGEIIRERCLAEGHGAADCEERAVEARVIAASAGAQAHLTVPGATADDWLDSGLCRDCDQPSFNYRPGGSAQYIMALGNFDDPAKPRHFRFGFMSSSDNHFGRPGTGYKEVHRYGFTESRSRQNTTQGIAAGIMAPEPEAPVARARAVDREELQGFALFELERQASFFMTGGLIGAHSNGRDRDSIWQAMQRREVYGTSGPRILLWFDLLNPPGTGGGVQPMGSAVRMRSNPIFRVRAVGSFEQQPGCPDYARDGLGEARLETVCRGECYHPSDRRRQITRIEIVRITPQKHSAEDIASLIRDPWRRFDCDPAPEGCAVTFTDDNYAKLGRDTLYYARAYEAPAPAINAENFRCVRGPDGACEEVRPCSGGAEDDCLGEHEPRAWSSPIFVDFTAL